MQRNCDCDAKSQLLWSNGHVSVVAYSGDKRGRRRKGIYIFTGINAFNRLTRSDRAAIAGVLMATLGGDRRRGRGKKRGVRVGKSMRMFGEFEKAYKSVREMVACADMGFD